MEKVYYICKYTPIEIIKAFGDEPCELSYMTDGFDLAEGHIHPNVCGFGKTIIEAVLKCGIKRLVLASCCDTIKSVYDVLLDMGCMEFLYLFEIMHCEDECSRLCMEKSIAGFIEAYSEYKGKDFSKDRFLASFENKNYFTGDYIALLGARAGGELLNTANDLMPYPVRDLTCLNNREVALFCGADTDFDQMICEYAGALLAQMPCMRMHETSSRRSLVNDDRLRGIIYHTIKFCDFYGFEYARLKDETNVPFLKIETDYTSSSSGQLATRFCAFAESLFDDKDMGNKKMTEKKEGYYAGIDSGSTSTDVVIIDSEKNIISEAIIPTGQGAGISADRALDIALEKKNLKREDVTRLITTGYGRETIGLKDRSITEITCHARGAYFLDNSIRTVIDIGGQDSKVIILNKDGGVLHFVMNDKCAAGTGRFLEMMANTLQLGLDEISKRGVNYKEDITISSMCTVFAESEVVSLIAKNKPVDDIVHGLNKAVAAKTDSLIKRANGGAPYMMTGGVSKNEGLVLALKEKLKDEIKISDKAQLCGALGAALFALEM